MIYLILGGRRSGKSRRGEELALSLSEHPVYLATSRRWDENHSRRIDAHIEARDTRWITVEEERHISNPGPDLSGHTVLLECTTMWLTNIFDDMEYDINRSLDEAKRELDLFFGIPEHIVIVSSETGLGIHPDTEAGRKFIDLQGDINQYIAARAHSVELVVAGLSMVIKRK